MLSILRSQYFMANAEMLARYGPLYSVRSQSFCTYKLISQQNMIQQKYCFGRP